MVELKKVLGTDLEAAIVDDHETLEDCEYYAVVDVEAWAGELAEFLRKLSFDIDNSNDCDVSHIEWQDRLRAKATLLERVAGGRT